VQAAAEMGAEGPGASIAGAEVLPSDGTDEESVKASGWWRFGAEDER
jgi:hypothetical protein